MEKYTNKNLVETLREIADYLEGCKDNGEDISQSYYEDFKTLIGMGMFHDACGKVVDVDYGEFEISVTTTTDY